MTSTSGKRPSEYVGLPRSVIDTTAYKSLPAWCRALYVDLRRQFRGFNNARIAATDTILGPLGWSHSTIHKGLALLIEHKLIERVRRGGLGQRGKQCSLYAFTDLGLEEDEVRGIKGRPPSLAYRTYQSSAAAPTMRRKKTQGSLRDQCSAWHGPTGRSTVHPVTLIAPSKSTL